MKMMLKTKLLVAMTAVIVMTGAITGVIGMVLINKGIISQVQDKVKNDLNAAREVFTSRIKDIRQTISFSSMRNCIKDALVQKDRTSLGEYFAEIRKPLGVEVLNITDEHGKVVYRSSNPGVYGDSQADDPMVEKVLKTMSVIASPVIVPREELLKDGEALAEQARIQLVPTPKAKKRPEIEETSGLMLKAAAPVFDSKKKLIGVLYGGELINRDYRLVDKIKSLVYQGETYEGIDMGTATIFQRDLRVSTNVMTREGRRAIGTRVSEEVYDKVLGEGKQWIDRAFVVNSWYRTAYEPIRDFKNNIIGILYVGMLEKKFVDIKTRTFLIFFIVTFLGMVIVMNVSNIFANRITKPLNYLVKVTRQISKGDFAVRVDVDTRDELGELEKAFNAMAVALLEREEELKNLTQLQLMRSEKLAALGRMAAGIAHEINNPLTGVLMYGHLILKKLPEDSQERRDMEIIVQETTRCREIIKDLLDFSRESIPEMQPANINDIIDKAVSIIDKQVYFEKVDIVKNYSEGIGKIMADVNQLEQVFINLALNGVEAMPDGGTLTIETKPSYDNKNIIIKISDTGIGIPRENLDKVFDPFFTTKEIGKGTGLGLAVTYGIIRKHGGQISVESEPGRETAFVIKFPIGKTRA